MNEKLLQFIWRYQIFNSVGLCTMQHEPLKILHPGIWNKDQGPDFKYGRIELSGQYWIGNIELHVRTSDWVMHQHDQDPNYHNVILHVVWEHDMPEHLLPVLELTSKVPHLLLTKYQSWSLNTSFISCSGNTSNLSEQIVYPFLSWLSSKRMQQKCTTVLQLVESLSGDWEEAFWRQLARCFGHKVNADSFERMAENLPYKILVRHQQNIKQLEAMMFGQAGLLHSGLEDDYAVDLHQEFMFLRRKYGLRKNVFPLYFLRMRPVNFPTIRLAQLASLIQLHPDLFKKIKDIGEVKEIKSFFKIEISDYWKDHFRFGEKTSHQEKGIGNVLMDKLIVNTILPFLRAYQLKQGKTANLERLEYWPLEMRTENNSIVSGYSKIGWVARNMQESQGLIELKTAYCDQLRCLDCAIGRHLLRKST